MSDNKDETGWTDERTVKLKELWAEGHSASQIAKRLRYVTRNAVIAKVHRLGLSGRKTPTRPVKMPPLNDGSSVSRPKLEVKAQQKPKTETKPVERVMPEVYDYEELEPLPLPSGDNVTVLTVRDSMCKWPIGDPSEDGFAFCGRDSLDGGVYCGHHANLAYQPMRKASELKRKTSNFAISASLR